MTAHEKALIVIKTFDINARQISEIIGGSANGAQNKMKNINYNKFTEDDFNKLLLHFQSKLEKQKQILDKF